MYGLINKLTVLPGQRETLTGILLKASQGLPGCHSYIVANDAAKLDVVWVTEVWADEASHKASLQRPEVKAAIEQGKPLVAGMPEQHKTQPLGGQGLNAAVADGG